MEKSKIFVMMALYYPGCAPIDDPLCSDCPDKEFGGIRSIFLKKKSYSFADITDPTEWATAICNKDVYVFPYTRGSLEEAETLAGGFGDTLQDLDSYEFTLNVFEPNFLGNCDFWNSIKKSKDFQVGWRTETQIYMSDVTTLIVPKAPVPEDLKTKVVWNIMFKFVQENIPCPLGLPIGTFDRCIACTP